MKRILSFLKKDAVLTAAWTLAILSMAAVPPSIRYISYLDLHTLLWSSIFVTLVAKKYHESVTLPSGLRMVYDNH